MKSLINNLINTPLLKEQLRRFSVIGVAGIILYLFAIIVPLISEGSRDGSGQERFLIIVMSMQNPMQIIWMVLAPFCVVMALYTYNFSRRVTSAFYTFPITKRQLFWTNFVTGTILMLLPLLILCISLLVPIYYSPHPYYQPQQAFYSGGSFWSGVSFPVTIFPADGLAPGATINSFGRIAAFFVRSAVGTMFYFSLFLVAISVAGNRVVSVLMCAALPFIPIGLHGLLSGVGHL